MKYLTIILMLVIFSTHCLAQRCVDTTKHGYFKNFIMSNADFISVHARYGCYWPNLIINSKCDSVFCNTHGIVISVFCYDSNYLDRDYAIIAKDVHKRFYTFCSLNKTSCRKGQKINKGDFLGLANKNDDTSLFELQFMITDKMGRDFDEEKIWHILKRQQKG